MRVEEEITLLTQMSDYDRIPPANCSSQPKVSRHKEIVKVKGVCSNCGGVYRLYPRTGNVQRHRATLALTTCSGSNRPPEQQMAKDPCVYCGQFTNKSSFEWARMPHKGMDGIRLCPGSWEKVE